MTNLTHEMLVDPLKHQQAIRNHSFDSFQAVVVVQNVV